MDGWMDGWMNGWMGSDEWMDAKFLILNTDFHKNVLDIHQILKTSVRSYTMLHQFSENAQFWMERGAAVAKWFQRIHRSARAEGYPVH